MNNKIADYFIFERKPRRGLLPLEWVVLAYTALTSIVMIVCYTKLVNPEAMIWLRIRVVATTLLLWGAYRLLPCRVVLFVRVMAQMAMLIWWYPDTFEINRMFTNLDHVFVAWEQDLFGFQPALLFSEKLSHPVFSELMDMGYASYYPLIIATLVFYFLLRYNEFERAAFVVFTGFIIYYVVFIFLPVAGPTFYYKAVGIDNIVNGVFPDIGFYFNTHQDCLVSPGWQDGLFYHLVEDAKGVGERPTAAFPSSHVGIGIVVILLAWHSRNRWLFFIMLPFFILLFFSTFYIQAHYAIDAIAGLVSGAIIYFILMALPLKR